MGQTTTASVQARQGQNQWLFVAFAFLSLLAQALLDNTRGPVFPDILNYFHLSQSSGAWFFSITSLTAFLTSLMCPVWLRRYSSFLGAQTAIGLMGLGGLVISWHKSFATSLVGAALLGVGMGLVGVMQNILVQEYAPRKYLTRVFAGLHTMYGLASFVSPLIVTYFYLKGWLWYQVFAVVSVPLVFVSFCAVFLRGPVRANRWEKHHVPQIVPAKGMRRLTAVLAIMLASYVVAEVLISARIVLYAREVLQMPIAAANDLLALFFVALLIGRFLQSAVHWTDRHEVVMVGSLVLSGGLYLLGLFISPWFLSAIGFTFAPFFPTTMTMISERWPERASSLISLVVSVNSLGLWIMYLIFGVISDAYGLRPAMLLGFSALLVSLVAFLVLIVKFPRDRVVLSR